MDLPAVRAESVGKRYHLGTGSEQTHLTETVQRGLAGPLRWLLRRPPPPAIDAGEEEIWAVRNVSFELEEGEVLGIVGPNGAGKSTLLKLLAEITLPTEGRITLHGRMSTLIEVGTGFHPDLTGRENVFLNGAILGMRRREIVDRYDEIADFAGIERFMETPVKRYSSGMYARLAFAVAAHLDPEILVVDEVLSVGDAEFQKKCLSKMRSVAGQGKAVVFVTHDLTAVERLCSRAMLLDHGEVQMEGTPEDVVAAYLPDVPRASDGVAVIPETMERSGTGEARLRMLGLTDLQGNALQELAIGQPFRVTATIEVFEEIEGVTFELGLNEVAGGQILAAHLTDDDRPPVNLSKGLQQVSVELEPELLPHDFKVGFAIHRTRGVTVDHVEGAHGFRVINQNTAGSDPYPWPWVRGYVRPRSSWNGPVGVDEPQALISDRSES